MYLSRYCTPGDPFLSLTDEDALAFALPHLRRMFPALEPQMILESPQLAGRVRAAASRGWLQQVHPAA